MGPDRSLCEHYNWVACCAECGRGDNPLAAELRRLTIDAQRILDVYPKAARGTYYEDLQRSVASARAALAEEVT